MFGNNKKSNQEGGDNSTNLQGKNVIINNGLSYIDAKEIALDVFRTNFLELSQNAANTAKQRAEELVEKFLNKLQEKDPTKLERIEDPDMQYALFTAQKEYARSGEKEMEDMLVNILLERIEENSQSLKKIVLNESLEVLPKLTNSQLDILTIVFLVHETINNSIISKETFKQYLNEHFVPFLTNLTKDKASYQHLQFTGCCGTLGIPDDNLSSVLSKNYKTVFSQGFQKLAFDSLTEGDESYNPLLIKCFNDPNLYQLNVNSENHLKSALKEIGKDNSKFPQLKILLDNYTFPTIQADNMIIELVPEMKNLIEVWKESYMCVMTPTSVGIMLAYINLKRKAGISINIDSWIK